MIIRKDNERSDAIKPIKFVRPILDKDDPNKIVRHLYISDDCELYDMREWDSHDYFENTPQAKIKTHKDPHGRLFGNIIDDSKYNYARTTPLIRLAKKAFDNPRQSEEFYETHEVVHHDLSIPIDNNISNAYWATHAEALEAAGESGVMIKKYDKDLIGSICLDMINGLGNKEIAEKYNINVNLVYDISIGKSHRSVTKKYLDKGFVYKEPDPDKQKSGRIELARKVCEIVKENPNITDTEVARKLGKNDTYRSTVHNIRTGYTHKEIAKEYGII